MRRRRGAFYCFFYFQGMAKEVKLWYNVLSRWVVLGRLPTTIKRRNCLMVNSKTIVFVLDLIGAIAIAASGVVAKHYDTAPQA